MNIGMLNDFDARFCSMTEEAVHTWAEAACTACIVEVSSDDFDSDLEWDIDESLCNTFIDSRQPLTINTIIN